MPKLLSSFAIAVAALEVATAKTNGKKPVRAESERSYKASLARSEELHAKETRRERILREQGVIPGEKRVQPVPIKGLSKSQKNRRKVAQKVQNRHRAQALRAVLYDMD